MSNKLKPYPTWVCYNCAIKAEESVPNSGYATFHEGLCDVCEEKKFVTEPRDYCYPKFEGHEE